MPITLGSNITSLQAQRRLNQSSETLARGLERLGSGMRINRASDDAAGLAIVSTLRADSRIFTQAIRNVSDGISLITIAQGALTQLTSLVTRQKELAEQAANGTYSYKQRLSLDKESDALVEEYNRIIRSTSFNGQYILDGNSDSVRLQHGTGVENSTLMQIGNALGTLAGDGSFGAPVSLTSTDSFLIGGAISGDFNEDGNQDIATQNAASVIEIFFGTGDGGFSTQTQSFEELNGLSGYSIHGRDVNGDGKLDILGSAFGAIITYLGNGDGTFHSGIFSGGITGTDFELADINNDGILDVVDSGGAINLGNGDGTFRDGVLLTFPASPDNVTLSDINNDGRIDIAIISAGTHSVNFYLGNGDGTFSTGVSYNAGNTPYGLTSGDFNGDGTTDFAISEYATDRITIRIGNGDGTFKLGQSHTVNGSAGITTGDFNGDGHTDIISTQYPAGEGNILFGNGDGSFQSPQIYPTGQWGRQLKTSDFNNDGVTDLYNWNFNSPSVFVTIGDVDPSGRHNNLMQKLDLRTITGAKAALDTATTYLERISLEVAALGAQESRLNVSLSMLATKRERYIDAASRISDVDIASESAQLIRAQILQKTTASILAQANKQPDIALLLLS